MANPLQVPPQDPLFDPNFLNLEYFFALIFRIFDWLAALLAYLAGLKGIGSTLLQKILFVILLLIIFGILYALFGHWKIRRQDDERFAEAHVSAIESSTQLEQNVRWQKVLELMDSPTEADWRVAILNADTMLDDMLGAMRYHGESVGEKLKLVERSDFKTLDDAWEAHKTRNKIAHEGGTLTLSKIDAERTINRFKRVFEEFHYI
jgi:hypothetical protein